jgi:hypothetical protein
MSKTIRRKRGDQRNKQHWLKDTIFIRSKYGGEYQHDFQVQGKEQKKRLAEYRSDHFPHSNFYIMPSRYRRDYQTRLRMTAKTALARLSKDPSYEVLVLAKPLREYWS